jgi:molybdopterin converting factor small subunit
MPKVIIPSPLRVHTNNQREVLVDADSLKETMECLLLEYPNLGAIGYESSLLSVFINSKMVKTEADEWHKLPLRNDDEVALIIPIAGG